MNTDKKLLQLISNIKWKYDFDKSTYSLQVHVDDLIKFFRGLMSDAVKDLSYNHLRDPNCKVWPAYLSYVNVELHKHLGIHICHTTLIGDAKYWTNKNQ